MPRLSKIGAAALAAFGWTSGANAVSASYLQVAGGGGGAGNGNAVGNGGGGGGAGGYLTGTTSLSLASSYTVIVGAGGAGASTASFVGVQGSNSQFGALTTSVGGGYGQGNPNTNGGVGGSGGGAYYGGSGGAGTSGQGNAGGAGHAGSGGAGSGDGYNAGGGGGAGAAASTAGGGAGGAGGAGLASSISGTSTYYAGGGGGGADNYRLPSGSGGAGGVGGGGNGADANNGSPGTANLGGGGGGSSPTSGGTQFVGGNGGSGVVIISYPSPQKFGGGIVTTSGTNVIHTFTTSGTLSPLSTLSASYLIVAGGGGGGYNGGGGGGAGGLLSGSGVTIDTNSTYLVTVGSGGTGSTTAGPGANGTNSLFSAYATSSVGGGGGAYLAAAGVSGGSGGGGGSGYATSGGAGGAGTSGQGNAGGAGYNLGSASPPNLGGGGGGGAGAVGSVGNNTQGGAGGNGLASSISGSSVTYAGGGGGGGGTATVTGGTGGGGAGAGGSTASVAGTTNLGGGGGGGGNPSLNGNNGGSGVVIISYAGATQLMAGGTVTISGGNVIHTFTSSGYLTPLKLVNNSLRFRSSASAYLNRTAGTSTNQSIATWSFWFKRGTLGATQRLFEGYTGNSDTGNAEIEIQSDNTLLIGGYSTNWLITTQVFRDPAAWYHIVVAFDTTQATSSNRIKLYVNGSQVTAFSTAAYPSQNSTFGLNNNSTALQIGRRRLSASNDSFVDGYLTEVNFIDGQALTPNSFGTFNSYGVWQPITYGGSYGTNGFYLPFTTNNSSTSYSGSFNGSSQYLTVAPNAALQMGTSDYTIECWVNFNNFTSSPVIYDSRYSGSAPALQFYLPSGVVNFYGGAGAATLLAVANTALIAGTWNHVAATRQSNATKLFINGVQQGATFTDSTNYNGGGGAIIGSIFNASANFVNGYISNFRLVKGTAVYTSNFTPSTTPLTAITNTTLLTLQNATIVDNSTNAFTVGNTGSVTTGINYPLAINVFKDQSPQGNNWIPNNISGGFGSTLDVMTDVPTLTSATAANYCVMNPLAVTAINSTITNGNLQVVTPSVGGNAFATFQIPTTGKWYYEVTPTSNAINGFIGISAYTVGSSYLWQNTNHVFYTGGGTKYVDGSSSAYGASYTDNDVIGVACDSDAGTITFYKNNTSQGSISHTMSAMFPALTDGASASGVTFQNNFGQQPFRYTPPANHLALNTFNL